MFVEQHREQNQRWMAEEPQKTALKHRPQIHHTDDFMFLKESLLNGGVYMIKTTVKQCNITPV